MESILGGWIERQWVVSGKCGRCGVAVELGCEILRVMTRRSGICGVVNEEVV